MIIYIEKWSLQINFKNFRGLESSLNVRFLSQLRFALH